VDHALDIEGIEWDDSNIIHAGRHGVTALLVEEMLASTPLFRVNLPGRSADYQMIGPDSEGRLWTVVLKYLGQGRWRPITGWPSTSAEVRWYQSGRGEDDGAE